MTLFGYTPAQLAKAITALVGVLGTLLTANLLPSDWAAWVSTVIGVLTVIGTYLVPNGAPLLPAVRPAGPQTPGFADHAA